MVKFPAYFSLSLDLRIIPRYKFVRELAPGEPFPTSVFMRFLRLKEDQFVLAAGLSARKQGLKRAGIHAKSTKQQTVPTFLESRHDDESNEGGRRIRRQDEETNQEGSCLDPKVAEQTEVLAAAAAFMPKGNDGTPGRFRRKPPVVA